MAEASITSRLLSNSAFNATAFVIGAGLNLLVLPFVVRHLGIAAFGMAGLVTACVAPALIFSTSLGLAASRELSQSLAAGRHDYARQIFSSALLSALAVGGLIVGLLVMGGPWFAGKAFNFTAGASLDLGPAFFFGSLGWLCQCLSSVFTSLFVARQDYARISSFNIFGNVTATAAMLIAVPLRPLASTFLACQALGFLAVFLMSWALAWQRLSGGLAFPAFHRPAINSLLKFGFWQAIAQGGGLVTGQADRYLLGILLPPQFVGFYVVAQRLEEAVYIGILKVGEILFPFFSVIQEETTERRMDLFFRSSWVLNLLAASALGGLIPVAWPLLNLWTGAEVADHASQLLVFLATAGILGCSANVSAYYLLAQGKSRANALVTLVTAAFTLVTSCIALPYFGWTAAGWSTCAGMLAQIGAIFWTVRRTFDRSGIWSSFGHFVVSPLLTGVVVALSLRYFLEANFHGLYRWWSVLVLYGLSAASVLVAIIAVSQIGPYGGTFRRDLGSIAHRFSLRTK